MDKGVNLNIDYDTWKGYKKLCIDLEVSPSKRIEQLMKKEIEDSKKK